jgi:hypothetical protein
MRETNKRPKRAKARRNEKTCEMSKRAKRGNAGIGFDVGYICIVLADMLT